MTRKGRFPHPPLRGTFSPREKEDECVPIFLMESSEISLRAGEGSMMGRLGIKLTI
jgi:hypothetical protein